MSTHAQRALSLVLASSFLLPACGAEDDGAVDDDIEFGLGGKADSICDPGAELCWNDDDSAVMRELLRAQDDVVLGVAPRASARHTLDMARGLSHKLTDEERAALDDLEPVIDGLPEQDVEGAAGALTEMQDRALHRVVGTYYAAQMVPLGKSLDPEGKFDESGTAGADVGNQTVPGLSPGMQESLQLLRDSGVLGMTIAEMYRMTGVLERDYEVVNAVNFGEYDPVTGKIVPKGMSREAKVEQIISKYRKAAGWVGAGAGAVGLVPIAGVALSISGETIALFKLHAQMGFEIASVYGWDLREGNNLFLMSMMFMTDGMLAEVGDVLTSNVIVPIIAKRVATKLGIELSADMAQKIASRSITQLMAFFTKKAQAELAEAALEAGAKGVGRQLLGWATLGLTVLVSAGFDYVSTDYLGRHIATVSKRWLADLLMEGTSYLSKPGARDCAMRAFAAIAWDDGELRDSEKNLFMAFLAKPYNVDEQNWFFLSRDEKVRQAQMLASWRSEDSKGAVIGCLKDEFQGTLDQHRMSLLAHLYAMVQIDQHQTSSERDYYDEIRDGLDGSGWFDGEAIDDVKMDYIERSVYVTINPNTIELSGEVKEVVETILVKDMLPFIAEPEPETQAAFECGFSGTGC